MLQLKEKKKIDNIANMWLELRFEFEDKKRNKKNYKTTYIPQIIKK